jgi:hypothetical protein
MKKKSLVSCFFFAFVLCFLISFTANQAEGQVLDIKPCYECTNCLINPDTSEPEPPLGETAIWIPCPGPSSINLCSNGVTAVGVLAENDDFDNVNSASATFLINSEVVSEAQQATSIRWSLEDVNHDGTLDLVFHFLTQELTNADGLPAPASGDACLNATVDGEPLLEICDAARFFFKGCDKGPNGQNNQIRNQRGPKK